MTLVRPYPEPDARQWIGPPSLVVTVPTELQVVMGASGKAEEEVELARLAQENVLLFKRRGGGGTVLLGPHCLVLTLQACVLHFFRNLHYFAAINGAVIQALNALLPAAYEPAGISDVAVNNRKLLGSSLFRSQHYLLYQASILVELPLGLMDAILLPPRRQPEYRQQRTHGQFLTCLRELGSQQSALSLAPQAESLLAPLLTEALAKADAGAE
jgi:lipoate-protein ligase A